MAMSLRRILKYTCAAVSLSWLGSQGLLVYHLKYAQKTDPLSKSSSDAIPLTVREDRKSIVDAVVGLYGLAYANQKMMQYAENAVFEDPFARLEGKQAIASAFKIMADWFNKSENLEINVVHGKHLITIDQLQRYTLPFLNTSFDIGSVIYLHLEDNDAGEERIVHHIEEWSGKALLGKDAPYLGNIGYVAGQFRKAHGWPLKYIFKAPIEN